MSELKLTGKIVAIMDVQVLKNDFSKREFVIETDDQYPQMVKLEFTQAKCSVLDTEKVGNQVTVSFNVRGKKWTNKDGKDVYFVSLNAWRLESAGGTEDDSFPQAQCEPPTEKTFDTELPF
jgi:hypothetical protein